MKLALGSLSWQPHDDIPGIRHIIRRQTQSPEHFTELCANYRRRLLQYTERNAKRYRVTECDRFPMCSPIFSLGAAPASEALPRTALVSRFGPDRKDVPLPKWSVPHTVFVVPLPRWRLDDTLGRSKSAIDSANLESKQNSEIRRRDVRVD